MANRIEIETQNIFSNQQIKMILQKNFISILKNQKVSEISRKEIKKIWFGRKKSEKFINLDHSNLKLCFNNEKISREHFEIETTNWFRPSRKIFIFLSCLKSKGKWLSYKLKKNIFAYMGASRFLILKDLGAYFGTWIQLKNIKLRANIGFSYKFGQRKFVQIHSHFFYEKQKFYEESECLDFLLEKNDLLPDSVEFTPTNYQKLLKQIKKVEYLIFNRSLINKNRHIEFLNSLVNNGNNSFTILFGTLGILDSFEPKNHFAAVFVNKNYDYVTFDNIILYFNMGAYFIAPSQSSEDFFDFNVAFSTLRGNRFQRKEIRIIRSQKIDLKIKINEKLITLRARV